MNEQRIHAIEKAALWLTDSGIVEKDDQHPAFGGVYLGVHRPKGTYPKVNHMVTGYGISAFTYLHRRRLRADDLELALQAASYLNQHRHIEGHPMAFGAINHSYFQNELKPVEVYSSFGNAMILQGLCDLYRATSEGDLLDTALGIGNWLVENMQRPDGSFYSRIELARRKRGHSGTSFDTDGGCLHAKNAIGLLRLHRLCDDRRFLRAAREVLNWVLLLQRDDGLFWANDRERYVFTHAHCYATEGMLFGSVILEDDRFIKSAAKAAEALLTLQLPDGSLPAVPEEGRNLALRALNMMLPYKATDATAQAARIWALMYIMSRDDRFLEAAHRAEEYLISVQLPQEAGRRFAGAFHYQEAETTIGLHVRSMLYTWVTQQSMFALYWLKDIEEGNDELPTILREIF